MNNILEKRYDPMGAAIMDYHTSGATKGPLRVFSSMFEEDEMPVDHLFRTPCNMPLLERKALQMARGKVLDIGAGAGCHSLALQNIGFEVTAVDISPLSCEVMKQRGIDDVRCLNIYDPLLQEKYDTILLLMNGTGIAGKIDQLPTLLQRLKALLAPGGQVLLDSSDLKYIYENEDGSFDINLNAAYYGEVDYQMEYEGIKGHSFDWLYVDFPLLQTAAASCGMDCQMVAEGEHYDYLAMLTASEL